MPVQKQVLNKYLLLPKVFSVSDEAVPGLSRSGERAVPFRVWLAPGDMVA